MIFGEGTLFEGVAATGSFLTPSHISFSILNKSASSTTGARHLWSSCMAPQNISEGAMVQMVHQWSTMASATVSSLHTSQQSHVILGSLGPRYSFLPSTARQGGMIQVPCIFFWMAGRQKAAACWQTMFLTWASSQHPSVEQTRGWNSSHHSGSQLFLSK